MIFLHGYWYPSHLLPTSNECLNGKNIETINPQNERGCSSISTWLWKWRVNDAIYVFTLFHLAPLNIFITDKDLSTVLLLIISVIARILFDCHWVWLKACINVWWMCQRIFLMFHCHSWRWQKFTRNVFLRKHVHSSERRGCQKS